MTKKDNRLDDVFGVVAIAQIAHEANRAYCVSIGDHSQQEWDASPEWQRHSAIDGVVFHLENPEAGDAASHDNWLRAKVKDGWVYGSVKDPDKKQHPCMVPFTALPPEQQKKDALFRAIVHALKSI